MNDIRYVLVTAQGAPVYTNGHKYSLRKGAGKWRVHTSPERDYYGLQTKAISRSAAKQLEQDVRWQPWTNAPMDLYESLEAATGCSGCSARESVIQELIDALRLGWIDLKSNKFKRLERIALEVTK